MNRVGQWLACVLLGAMFSGCGGGGLDEGTPSEIPANGPTPEAKAFIEQNSKNMTSLKKGRPKAAPAPTEKTAP